MPAVESVMGSHQQLPHYMLLREEERWMVKESEEPVVPRLPLFSRCPITNKARLETPSGQDANSKQMARIPLNSISNVSVNNSTASRPGGVFGSQWSMAAATGPDASPFAFKQQQRTPGTAVYTSTSMHKPSLDEVRDNSVVALTNKFGKGKYWFKSACPTPDPRWAADQQLMIGPIPGDVEYSQLRSAFLAQGHTLHLFIQNNQGWLEKNQEKFGDKHVKFGYVVYTERDTALRLLITGYVAVGNVKIRVKEMDGKPALFFN